MALKFASEIDPCQMPSWPKETFSSAEAWRAFSLVWESILAWTILESYLKCLSVLVTHLSDVGSELLEMGRPQLEHFVNGQPFKVARVLQVPLVAFVLQVPLGVIWAVIKSAPQGDQQTTR